MSISLEDTFERIEGHSPLDSSFIRSAFIGKPIADQIQEVVIVREALR